MEGGKEWVVHIDIYMPERQSELINWYVVLFLTRLPSLLLPRDLILVVLVIVWGVEIVFGERSLCLTDFSLCGHCIHSCSLNIINTFFCFLLLALPPSIHCTPCPLPLRQPLQRSP